MCRLCTQRHWLGVARHGDECQLQLGLRATGYWLLIIMEQLDHLSMATWAGIMERGRSINIYKRKKLRAIAIVCTYNPPARHSRRFPGEC